MSLKVLIALGLGLYALLSATDWIMTYALLRSQPDAIEANPLAAACLERYGWDGLALFKFGGVLVFTGAVFLLARRRKALATVVVGAGCAVLLTVTIYTHHLICEWNREMKERALDAAWPKPKPKPQPTGYLTAIPQQCWFASDQPVSTAARK